jgi:biotin carboxyl carrier protein
MKLYNITVNGTQYEVEVEEVSAGSQVTRVAAPAPAAAPVATAPAPVAAPAAAPAAAAPAAPKAAPAAISEGAFKITAPIPGTILDVRVAVGDAVKNGQLILILEAMKMENEIFASQAGIVEAILVSKSDSVNAGDVMVSLK